MKVLFVCSYKENLPGNVAPFILEQEKALSGCGVEIQYYLVKGQGISGYIKSLPGLKREIRKSRPNLIHAHYGLCGLLANLQRKVPVVTTYHGSDINNPKVRRFSSISIRLSAHNIFVSRRQLDLVAHRGKYSVIPCGINLEDYPIIEKSEARKKMGLDPMKKYILFAGAFDNPVKNFPLAEAAIELVPGAELLELKGFSRQQVAILMSAVDCFLMTSHSEGSPQVIKEAMACGCPIVSVDVGDVGDVISGVDGCFISERSASDTARKLNTALSSFTKTRGRERIQEKQLTNERIASLIFVIYQGIIF